MRVMPNTPALVGEGMTALCDDSTFSKEDFDFAKGIFDSIGKTKILPERLFDGVVAISGSSPAYVYMMIEAMADAGVREGLPRVYAYEKILVRRRRAHPGSAESPAHHAREGSGLRGTAERKRRRRAHRIQRRCAGLW